MGKKPKLNNVNVGDTQSNGYIIWKECERNIFYELGTFFELLFLEPTEETICMLK